jgi:ubiquinone/menaquinone biosynthesis C-methylase UbiE
VEQNWPIKLFNKSVQKQQKYKELCGMLGPVDGRHCLDIGSDNGVISYLFRQQGGTWKSADLDTHTVESIRGLVGEDVYQLDGGTTPFMEDEFDAVVIVDFLEHIPNDAEFVQELHRIIKPGGSLIINVPHQKDSLLRRFRNLIGQTDEQHGHLRPGYTPESLRALAEDCFTIQTQHTYSKFFSEFIDTMIVFGVSLLKRGKGEHSQKGNVVTGQDMSDYGKMFKLFSLIYPVVWVFSRLDHLLFFRSGYMLIARAQVNK